MKNFSTPQPVSLEFKRWYRNIIGKDIPNPHFYFLKNFNSRILIDKLSQNIKKGINNIKEINGNCYFYFGGKTKKELEIFNKLSLIGYLKFMPPITSADLIQNNKKQCRLLTLDLKKWYVVVELPDPKKVIYNWNILKKLTDQYNLEVNNNKIKIHVLNDWIIFGESGKYFLVSPFLASTIEMLFKTNTIKSNEKKKVIIALKKFINLSEHEGFLWRDLAPRNILLAEDKHELFLIDYEYLYEIKNIEPYKKLLLDINRKIWFGDILPQRQILYLFDDAKSQKVNINQLLKADEIERKVFSKNIISLKEKLVILNRTSLIERIHRYNKEKIYGHRIGRFLSDFVSSRNESKLYIIFNMLDKKSFSRFLSLIQKCIEVDSEEILREYYKLPVSKRDLTINFLNSLNLIDINKEYVLKKMKYLEKIL